MTEAIKREDRDVLRYAGMMGHTYCLVGTVNGERRVRSESDDIAFSRRHKAELAEAGEAPVIYRKTARGWKVTA